MKRQLFVAAAALLVLSGAPAMAQNAAGSGTTRAGPPGQNMNRDMMNRDMMSSRGMGPSMMDEGDRHSRMPGHGGIMRIIFAMMDTDGDGALALQEVQDAHARIFKHMDADDNGKVTPEEIAAFFRGPIGGTSAR